MTPLLRQYVRIKAQHPDHVLFFRCGDFYEMFSDDARLAARVLGITLTKRGTDQNGDPIPLAGVPYHSVEPYLARFIRAGYKVAICEQVENPKTAKGVVRREVVRVVTPGTVLEDNLLDNKSNNYLSALIEEKGAYGLAALDFSTGQFAIAEFHGKDAAAACSHELTRLNPTEIVLAREQKDALAEIFGWSVSPGLFASEERKAPAARDLKQPSIALVESSAVSVYAARNALLQQFGVRDLNGFGAENSKLGVCAAGAILQYLRETQRQQLVHLNELRVYSPGEFMTLDSTTQRSLELVANLTDATRGNTLLEVLDNTSTSMGARTLKSWVLQPLRNQKLIEARLEAVAIFVGDFALRAKTIEALRSINDLERIVSRVACRTANARDLLGLRNSLQQVPVLRTLLESRTAPDARNALAAILRRLDPLTDLAFGLQDALADNPPVTVREGGMIKAGFNPTLDELRAITSDSKTWIASMRQNEAERTGIANLKIGYNRVFGYYIEISNSHAGKVPPDYIRKQTLVNAERFITPDLKEKEEVILHAEERMQELEFEIFEGLCKQVCASARPIQDTARAIAELDTLLSLAQAAVSGNYCKPEIHEGSEIQIVDGRHPVLEALDLDQPFVPNDTLLNNADGQILLITGPNMAGKSTYIRQVALITLLSHVGSFVPARSARIGLVDRIFTRVGAMDQLARGQSTFLVEMSETANILNNTTDHSLVILDEIGRGTSTYDGLSIAWAVIEYLHNTPGRRPKTLFATHYHELVELEETLPRLRNFSVAVLEEAGRVAFLYKIVRGSTDHSYGIYAAQVAGLPRQAIARAREILTELEQGNAVEVRGGKAPKIQEQRVQLTLFDAIEHPAITRLRALQIDSMTPLQALALLAELVAEARQQS